MPDRSGITSAEEHKFGEVKIKGEIPSIGSIIRIETFKPFSEENRYEIMLEKADLTNKEKGKENIEQITVFPNPYYGNSENREEKDKALFDLRDSPQKQQSEFIP